MSVGLTLAAVEGRLRLPVSFPVTEEPLTIVGGAAAEVEHSAIAAGVLDVGLVFLLLGSWIEIVGSG